MLTPKTKIRSLYSERVPVLVSCPPDECRTIEYPEGSCDINQIVERYRRTGAWPGDFHVEAKYVDFSDDLSFHDLQNIKMSYANSLSEIERQAFLHAPSEYLESKMREYAAASAAETDDTGGTTNVPPASPVSAEGATVSP